MALGGFMKFGLLASTAIAMFAAPALADEVSMKDTPVAGDKFDWTVNLGGTSDYVFRGVSQNRRDPSVQGGVDATYGMFYAGVWASNVNFDGKGGYTRVNSHEEIDLYGGIHPKWKDVTFDFGIITYNYPNSNVVHPLTFDPFYYEFKAGAAYTIPEGMFKDLALGGTVYISPNYSGETGTTATIEGTASKSVYKYADIDFAASGTVGHVFYTDSAPSSGAAAGVDYTYGNLGVTATYKAFSLDFRWWDTDLTAGTGACAAASGNPTTANQCGSAFAATAKVTF